MRIHGALLLSALVSGNALACSCATTPLSEKVEKAEFVGIVRVESTHVRPGLLEFMKHEELPREAWLPVIADFVAINLFKGSVEGVDALATGFGGGDCGMPLVPGTDYLVIGDVVSRELDVVLCSGSQRLGPESLMQSLPNAERWHREHALVSAVERQLSDGTPVPACLDNNPRFMQRESCELPEQ